MENVLDLLYEYSKRNRKADETFSKKVIQIVSTEYELKKYLRKVVFKTLPEKEKCPLMYNFGYYRLQVDQQKLERYYFLMREKLLTQRYSKFELTLAANSFVLHGLLHDLEHVNQSRKSRIGKTFEDKLLAICLYVGNEYADASIFSKWLMHKYGIFTNPILLHNLKLYNQLTEQYGRLIPLERMADIQATREINELLKKLGKIEKIENVIELFYSILERFYLKGYSPTCLSPIETYLNDVQNLGFLEIEKYFNQEFFVSLEDAKSFSLEERLLFGLPISLEEHHKVKTLGIRNI